MTETQLASWWHRLTRPNSAVQEEEELQRVRLFLSLQLLLFAVALLSLPLMIHYGTTDAELLMCILAISLTFAFFVFGHTRWYRQTIQISSAIVYLWFLFVIQMFPFPSYSVIMMTLPLVFISLFHSVRTTLCVSVMSAPLLFGISLFIPVEYPLTAVLNVVMLLAIAGGMTVGTHMRERYLRRLEARAQQVQEREARYRQLFDITPLSLWVIDFSAVIAYKTRLLEQHGASLRRYLEAHPEELNAVFASLRVLDFNDATLSLLETTRQVLLDPNIVSMLSVFASNRQALLEAIIAFADGADQVEFELTLVTGGGRQFDALVHWTPAPGYDPSAQIMIVSMEDVTARKQAEQQRIELAVGKERVQVIQRFVGDISHDLLTPLSVIRTSAYLVGKRHTDPSLQEKLTTIDTQVEHVQSMVRDMLMLTRLEQPNDQTFAFAPEDVDALLSQLVGELSSIATHNGQHLVYESGGASLIVDSDSEKMRRALTNIINNALKYTPRGGTIRVFSKSVRNEVVVEVQDTGPGIPADEVPHVFDRFYRAREHRKSSGGLGLGLAIVDKIIRAHQGRVEVESVVNHGTTFRVRLPLKDPTHIPIRVASAS